MKKINQKSGFTLIELLVVIAIIAILAAILFPVFAQAKMAAKKSADLSNLKQIVTSVAIYTADYDDIYPYANFQPVSGVFSSDRYRWSSSQCLGPYIKNTNIFSTPGDHQIKDSSSLALTPAARNLTARTNSYMANALVPWFGSGVFPAPYDTMEYGGVFPLGNMSFTTGPMGTNPSSTTGLANPSEIVMFAGGAVEAMTALGFTPTPTLGPNTEAIFYQEDMFDVNVLKNIVNGTVSGVANAKMKSAWEKFNGVSNFAFPDGHAKAMSPKALKSGVFLDPKRFIRDAS